jgi:hypothetical protein
MSEYQYYEFRAVDRRLTGAEMKRLRGLSTRAEITPVSFTNHYEWGDFKGDPTKLMWRCFDAFLYLANWGTRRLMLRLPADLIDRAATDPYCVDDSLSLKAKAEHALLEFQSQDEEGDWEHTGEGLLEELLPLREALIAGDLRPLYVGWLMCINEGLLDDDEPEPPVPPGLRKRSPALDALINFLRVPKDLLDVAAEASPDGPTSTGPTRDELVAKVSSLPEADRTTLLLDLVEGEPTEARRALLRKLRKTGRQAAAPAGVTTGRTAGALISIAQARVEGRLREAAEWAARKKARLDAEAAAKHAKYLERLSGLEEEAWAMVETKVESKQQAEYDAAVGLLKDLREINVRGGALRSFETRVRALHARHAKKSTFVERLQKAGMLKWGGAR